MLTLLLFIIGPPPDPPPGPVQLINTELDSTPLTVFTVQTISTLIPTLGWLVGGSSAGIPTKNGAVCKVNKISQVIYYVTGTRDLPDMYTISPRVCSTQGQVKTYLVNHDCTCCVHHVTLSALQKILS